MSEFGDRVDAFLAEFFRLYPVAATAIGMHAHDGEWTDVSEQGRQARLAFASRWEASLAALDPADLSADDRIDRDLLLAELAAIRFDENELREGQWDALSYVYLIGGGIFPLLARDFAPLPDRLASVAARLEGVPRVLEAAKSQLGGAPDRPASRLHTETALRQLPGVAALADDAVGQASAAPDSPELAGIEARLRDAAAAAGAAIDDFRRFLEDDLLERSTGEGRLGPELYARKLRHTFKTDLTGDQILAEAQREFEAVRAEMIRIARAIWPEWCPGEPAPSAEHDGTQEAADERAVREVVAAIGRIHHQPTELVDFCRQAYWEIVDFCSRKGLVDVPNEPLEIDWTPPFLREFAGAMLDAPGPLDKGQKTFYFMTPPPEDWSASQVESYLAEENDRQLRLTTIHEGTPGHYLQLVYSNRCPSLVRAVFQSGVFIEGWAVYVTQVMIDAGYGADDPALRLVHWKFYLRAIVNAIIDVQIHAGSMSEAGAMDLMTRGAFQEESEARKKWDRARLTSTQLSTYFVGSTEMWNLERERRRRLAVAAGAPGGVGAVPQPEIVGGFGATPGFSYREHLEAVLAHGSPPVPLLRRILLGEE